MARDQYRHVKSPQPRDRRHRTDPKINAPWDSFIRSLARSAAKRDHEKL